jgi:hypothetical protein
MSIYGMIHSNVITNKEGGGLILLVRYFKGAGSSLFVGILLFLLTVKFNGDYIKMQLLFVTLYNYIFCLLGIVLFFVLTKTKTESNCLIGLTLYILLGLLSSLSFPPMYYILIAGSLTFYLVQLIQNKGLSTILILSGPLFLIILLLAI